MSTWSVGRGLFFGCFACILLTSVLVSAAEETRPNFVFILADDCNYNLLGCYGGTEVKTPNIDRLAREGMQFERAYCAIAMCAPFRTELYTGLYPMRSGSTRNHTSGHRDTKSVVAYLGELGYRVGLSGKRHVHFPLANVKGFPAGPGVREFITHDREQPFCLFLCSNNPHAAWTTGDASQFDAATLKLAPVQHDNPATREAMTRYLAEVGDLDREVGEILQMLDETGAAKNTLVMFSSEQGWALGFAKWTNWDLGVHTALLARWPGKIEPGSTTGALVQMADVVPTFIDVAGGAPEKHRLDGSSFLPVLTGDAETHREYVYGMHNNVPEGQPYPIRYMRDDTYHYIRNLTPDATYHEKHVQADNSRLVWWPALKVAEAKGDARAKELLEKFHHRPAEELYLVDDDPYELNNLADDPVHAPARERLRAELDRWMREQGDPGATLDQSKTRETPRRKQKREKT